jgi:membrane fusion protein (multidrug efflux system)
LEYEYFNVFQYCKNHEGVYKVVLLLVYFYVKFLFSGSEKNAKVVEVFTLDVKNVTQSVRLIGTIEAKKSSILTAKVSGTLDYVAHTGQKISKGELIAKLENADLEKAYSLSQSAEKNAEDQYVRIQELEKRKLARKEAVEDRKNQWIETQKNLNEAKRALEQTLFIAPFDGTVGGYKLREGAQVQVGAPIVSFYDPSELIVTFDIPTDILKIIQTPFPQAHDQGHKVIIDGKKIIVPHIQRMVDPDTRMSPAYVNYSCPNCIVGSNIPLDFIVAKHTKVLVIYPSLMKKAICIE